MEKKKNKLHACLLSMMKEEWVIEQTFVEKLNWFELNQLFLEKKIKNINELVNEINKCDNNNDETQKMIKEINKKNSKLTVCLQRYNKLFKKVKVAIKNYNALVKKHKNSSKKIEAFLQVSSETVKFDLLTEDFYKLNQELIQSDNYITEIRQQIKLYKIRDSEITRDMNFSHSNID